MDVAPAASHNPKVTCTQAMTPLQIPVIKLVDRAGLFLLFNEGRRAKLKGIYMIAITISSGHLLILR